MIHKLADDNALAPGAVEIGDRRMNGPAQVPEKLADVHAILGRAQSQQFASQEVRWECASNQREVDPVSAWHDADGAAIELDGEDAISAYVESFEGAREGIAHVEAMCPSVDVRQKGHGCLAAIGELFDPKLLCFQLDLSSNCRR